MKKHWWLLLLLTLGTFFAYGVVSALFVSYQGETKNIYKSHTQLYTDSKANKILLVYKSNLDLRKTAFHTSCETHTKFLQKKENLYAFELEIIGECDATNIQLRYKDTLLGDSRTSLGIFGKSAALEYFTDYSTEYLEKIFEKNLKIIEKNHVFRNYSMGEKVRMNFYQAHLKYHHASVQNSYISDILTAREKKYLVPVAGHDIMTQASKIPNASRKYRALSTHGIHESWDINTNYNEPVIALDDAVVVRVVDNWDWSDFARIDIQNLTEEKKLKNLDIYRGNQIWLKTMKGEVVFYAHLNHIYSDIQVGDFVARGTALGTVGISGVPDKKYTDYHLDFSIRENPYNQYGAGSYDFGDYMAWPWKMKGKSKEYILEHQYDFFEK